MPGNGDLAHREAVEIEAGRDAELLLASDTFRRAFARLQERYEHEWRASQLSQVDRREECFRLLASLDQIQKQLQKDVETGKLAVAARNQRAYAKEHSPEHGNRSSDAS